MRQEPTIGKTVTEQHKQECLYRQALAFNEDEKKRFMDMYRKVHGQEALDKFREAVNDYHRMTRNAKN